MHETVLDEQARSHLLERVFDELVAWRIASRDPEEQERLLEPLQSRVPSVAPLLAAVREGSERAVRDEKDPVLQGGAVPAELIPYLLLMFPVE